MYIVHMCPLSQSLAQQVRSIDFAQILQEKEIEIPQSRQHVMPASLITRATHGILQVGLDQPRASLTILPRATTDSGARGARIALASRMQRDRRGTYIYRTRDPWRG
jgi:hypothetical protein